MAEKGTEKNIETTNEKTREFQAGDLAVYPAHGVGRIEAIESRVVNGETHDFYIMKVLENGMLIKRKSWRTRRVIRYVRKSFSVSQRSVTGFPIIRPRHSERQYRPSGSTR